MSLFPIKYGIQIPNWRLMIEIIWHSNDDSYTYKINNGASKFPFVAMGKVWLSFIWGYTIENARDWWIYNKVQFKVIEKKQDCTWLTNNVQHRTIRIHRESTVTHRNTQECTGEHGIAQEITLKKYNVQQIPSWNTNKCTNKYTLTPCCCWCCGYFWKKYDPKFLTQS